MDKAKIVYLTTSYPMQANPASGIFVQRLISHMPNWVEPLVITPDARVNGALQIDGKTINVKTFRYAPKKWQTIAHGSGGIPVALKNNKLLYLLLPVFLLSTFFCTLYHSLSAQLIHANWSINGMIAGFIGMLINKPVVTTLRGEDITRATKYKFDQLILRCCVNWSAGVVCVNHSHRQWITQRFPTTTDKVFTIENGVEQRFLHIGEKRRHNNGSATYSGLRLLAVGSLIKRKRFEDIINALSRLNGQDLSLTIAGDGPELGRLQQLMENLHLQGRVKFTGAVQPDELLSLLETHDAFVLTSESEGRPNVLLEAMAAGLPVVTTKLPGIVEFLSHKSNGLLFDVGDIEQLQKLIGLLRDDTDLRTVLGQSAHDYIVSHQLNWNHTANNYAELYQSVLAQEQTS